MVSINKVHRVLDFLCNTEGRGNVKRENKDLAINQSVNEIFEELLFEVNRIINRQNRGLINGGLESTTEKIREKIQHYLESKTIDSDTNVFIIPKEVRYFDTVLYKNTFAELCKNNKEFLLSKGESTEEYPIGLKTSNRLNIFPETVSQITISYLRNPVPAKWAYRTVNGIEIFDQSKADFKDIDIHPSEEDKLIIRTLQKFGINLKEKDLQTITQQIENTEFNKEITN